MPDLTSSSEEDGENEIEPHLGIFEGRQRVKKFVKKFERVPKKKWIKWKGCGCEGECNEDHEKQIQLIEEDKNRQGRILPMKFQVAEVKKPLMAEKKIVESGNHVSLGLSQEDNYIWNKKTGDKVMLKGNGKGSCLMHVDFPSGENTKITIDSGAEENVCPKWWGEQFKIENPGKMKFTHASGGSIAYLGERNVKVTAPF